jgi:protein TonB
VTVIAERYSAANDLPAVPVVPFSPLRHRHDSVRELAAIMIDFVQEPMFPAFKPSATEVKMALGLSVIMHAACVVLMLGFGDALFQEERSAGAPNPVWGISASSVGVEIVPLHAFESAANAAKPNKVMPEKEVLEETKPSEIASNNPEVKPVEPLKEVKTPELAAVDPKATEAVRPMEEVKPDEPKETVEARSTLPFEAIGEQSDTSVPEATPETVEGPKAEVVEEVAPDKIEELKVEDVEVAVEPPPPPPKEVASVAQTASGGPVGQVAGRGGSRSDTEGQADISSYLGLVVAHLRRFKRYPAEAQAANVQGTARITFRVGAKGEVLATCIVASSGAKLLDEEAVAMVARAGPFPPIPPDLRRTSMTFTVPVRFQR